MTATEVEEVQRSGNGERGTGNGGEIEKSLDIGDFDWWATLAKVGLYPALFGFACGDKSLSSAKAEALDGADKCFLPPMICATDGVIAALRNPMDILAPKSSPPEARHP